VQPFPDFIATNEDHYRAELSELDFYDPQSVDIMNSWVREQTEDRIEKILENIAPEEIMFLINALYLKADWVSPFNIELTSENDFHVDFQQTLKADFMHQRGDFYYTSTESYQAVDLMLADSAMSMTLIMPNEGEAIANWIANWTIDGLENMYDLFYSTDIRLIIPKFELGFHIELKRALEAMGIRHAFDPSIADFSRLGTSFGNIFLSRVEHKTYVNMDEFGVEGAAVTAVGVGTTSVPPSVMFNRPFVFIIRDVPSNSILYFGKVSNPIEKSDE
jgi:serpin B